MKDVVVIIAGGRDFTDYKFLCRSCESVLQEAGITDPLFIGGGADGADKLGEDYVHHCWQRKVSVMRPDYKNNHPQVAPLIRNRNMAVRAKGGILIAFLSTRVKPEWQNTWRITGGTTNMILNAIANSMAIHTFRYDSGVQ